MCVEAFRDFDVEFHNAVFDVGVAKYHLNLYPQREIHCTMVGAFIKDPRVRILALKELTELWLGEKPAERDALRDWVVANVPEARRAKKNWGAYISRAPGDLVAPYACGDTNRTKRLGAFIRKTVVADAGLSAAYAREMALVPVILAMQERGVGIARRRLARDLKIWELQFSALERAIYKKLGGEFEISKPSQLIAALERSGLVDEWILTPGKDPRPSLAHDALVQVVKNKDLVYLLDQRAVLATYVNTFAKVWLRGSERDGRFHVEWRSTRRERGGARTGRWSSSPNLQNVPAEENAAKLGLPNLRDYIVPARGRLLIDRDYSQQELRILGHYEDGPLLAAYRADPRMDIHARAQVGVSEIMGEPIARKPIKNLGFGIIYGQGIALTAAVMGVDVAKARRIKKAYLALFPGIKTLSDELRAMAGRGEPLRTWGGRLYYCEPPRVVLVDGLPEERTYEYKMLNLLIQGSAADCTKEALVRAHAAGVELELQVHDQVAAEADDLRPMTKLREAMESVEFDVKMLTDGRWSKVSWGRLKKLPEGQ